MLALDDDLAPFHRAHRRDPVLGRIIKARPKLRVLRKPAPFEALAWAVIEQLIDTQRAGNIAWEFTRRHGTRHESGAWAAPPREAFQNQAALEACGLAPTQARTLARVARVPLERARRCPASASGRSPTSTCSATAATTCRSPRTSGCATPTRGSPACAPGASPKRSSSRARSLRSLARARRHVHGRRRLALGRAVVERWPCPTSPPRTATTGCPTAAAGAAASSCPRSASGCGTASATTRPCRTSATSSAARSISASRTSTSRTTTGRPPARPSATSGRSCARTCARTATS